MKDRTGIKWIFHPNNIIVLVAFVFIALAMGYFLPEAIDWHIAFRPAALTLLSGQSPYNVPGYFNAPWALLPLIPFAILPEHIGRGFLAAISLAVFGFTAFKMGATRLTIPFILLSPPVLHGVLNGNIDWLATLGFIMPPQIGIFFVSIKPQIGVAVGVFWLIEAFRVGGIREVVRVFGPFSIALGMTFLLFGFWPLRFERELDLWWNASLWPMSIPAGLVLLVTAVRTRHAEFSMGASPLLSPYVLFHSYVGALLALSSLQWETMTAVIGLWILIVIQSMG